MGGFICQSVRDSVHRHNEMGNLWIQLLQFLSGLFETLHVFFSWSKDVHVVVGLSSYYYLSTSSWGWLGEAKVSCILLH